MDLYASGATLRPGEIDTLAVYTEKFFEEHETLLQHNGQEVLKALADPRVLAIPPGSSTAFIGTIFTRLAARIFLSLCKVSMWFY